MLAILCLVPLPFSKSSWNIWKITVDILLKLAAKSLQSCLKTAAHQAPPSLGFSRQEHWSEKSKWSCSVVSDSLQPHELQPTRYLMLCKWGCSSVVERMLYGASPMAQQVSNLLAVHETQEMPVPSLGGGRSPGGGNGYPLLYSCLEKSCRQRSLAGYMTEWLTLYKAFSGLYLIWSSNYPLR